MDLKLFVKYLNLPNFFGFAQSVKNIYCIFMEKSRLGDLKKQHQLENETLVDGSESLKNKSISILVGYFFKWKKKTSNRIGYITTITIIISVIFFAANIGLSIGNTSAKLSTDYSSLFQKLTKVLTSIKSKENLENSLKDVSESLNELDKSLKIIDLKIWPILNTSSLTMESIDLFQSWVLGLSNLAQFKFSGDGFTSDLPRNFTDYLSDFLDLLPELINKTSNFIFKIRVILSWTFWIPAPSIEKIKSFLNISEDLIDIIQDIYINRTGILEFLGYKDLHKMLIFNQNIGESRPTGGFIGSYLSLNISQGRFDIGKSQSIYNLDDYQNKAFVSFPASWNYDLQYGRYGIHGIRNLNYFSCFPDSAKLIESEFSRVPKGQSADTVVFLTPNLIQNLFDPQTELKVKLDESLVGDLEDKVITITKDNFYNQIEKLTALDFKDINNPKSSITPILIAIIGNLNNIISKQDPIKLSLEFLHSGFSRNIQIWSKSQALENLWQNFHLAGTQTCRKSNNTCGQWWSKFNNFNCIWSNENPNLSFIQANLSSDKRDIFAKHDFNFKINKNDDSTYSTELNYTRSYKNLDQLQQKFNSRNGVTFIGFVLPPDAKNYSIQSDSSLNTSFLRPFYLLKIKDQSKQDIYTPPVIQSVIDSSIDINSTSFTYLQPDQSLVLGTYINEQDVTSVKLRYSSSDSFTIFYPTPANSNNTINADINSKLMVLGQENDENSASLTSKGEGVLITSKLN